MRREEYHLQKLEHVSLSRPQTYSIWNCTSNVCCCPKTRALFQYPIRHHNLSLQAARLVVSIITSLWNLPGTSAVMPYILYQELISSSLYAIVWKSFNTLRPRQNGCLFADNVFKCIFLNENVWISITISLKFVPKGPINNIPALVQIMAWRRPGDKPLTEPMLEKKQGIKNCRVHTNCPKTSDKLERTQCKTSEICLCAPFQVIPSMHSPENALKPQIWHIWLSQNCTKIRKINRLWPKWNYFVETIRIHQHTKFQAIPPMLAPLNAHKPLGQMDTSPSNWGWGQLLEKSRKTIEICGLFYERS